MNALPLDLANKITVAFFNNQLKKITRSKLDFD